MPDTATKPGEHFALNATLDALTRFQAPTGAFDPLGAWRNEYDVLTLASLRPTKRASPVGRLSIERKPDGANAHSLAVRLETPLPGKHREVVTATLRCATDPLGTPVSWEVRSEMLTGEGHVVAGTRSSTRGDLASGSLRLRCGGSERRLAVSGRCAASWALFEAVQRLPRERTTELPFVLIDHFDQPKPNQVLAFRKSATVELGGRVELKHATMRLDRGVVRKPVKTVSAAQLVRLHAYEQLGEGILPITYWVDDREQLLFVFSGLEGYVLRTGRVE